MKQLDKSKTHRIRPMIVHQSGEYVIDAPDGYRFAGLDCHQLVVDYGGEGLTRKQGYCGALAEMKDSELEQCPGDCPCKE